MPTDLALGVLLPLHGHIGLNFIITDYLPKFTKSAGATPPRHPPNPNSPPPFRPGSADVMVTGQSFAIVYNGFSRSLIAKKLHPALLSRRGINPYAVGKPGSNSKSLLALSACPPRAPQAPQPWHRPAARVDAFLPSACRPVAHPDNLKGVDYQPGRCKSTRLSERVTSIVVHNSDTVMEWILGLAAARTALPATAHQVV
jgi:hypothetical protein